MRLRNLFLAWVFVLFIELYWLYFDKRTEGVDADLIYTAIIITLVVGITGLNLYNKNIK